MRKIFILEDNPERIRHFRAELGLIADLTIIDTVADVDQFPNDCFVAFFDHDLGGRQLEDHEDNGAAVAALLVDKIYQNDTIVIIHSYNADGAQRIRDTLGHGALAPFRGNEFNGLMSNIKLALEP